ncbi:hypothetical protein RM545_06445 [Zunongwangia sp. F260]|uniref:Uncharacterized protein n=1 Tax=Autumnicola lenta TaxID=3075593 RepID=A0ABU3CIY9_9FLAO|nr:hypothetical protein [Zunongwangia sp. F260]MDT0646324.1 hypothetical protein [Zunongwangia sp. F260]
MFDNRNKFILRSELGRIELDQDPDGWDDTKTEISRSEKTYGIFVAISNNLRFTGRAKEYLDTVYDAYKVQGHVKLTKLIKHPQTDEWIVALSGYLDLTSRRIKDGYFECDFLEGGLRELFTANIREKFELNRTTDIKGNSIPKLETHKLTIEGRDIYLLSKLGNKDIDKFTAHSGKWNSIDEDRTSFHPLPLKVIANADPENIQPPFPTYELDDRWNEPSMANMFYYKAERDMGRTRFSINTSFKLDVTGNRINDLNLKLVFDRYICDDNGDNLRLQEDGRTVLKDLGDPRSINPDELISYSSPEGIELEPKKNESFALGLLMVGQFGGGFPVRFDGWADVHYSGYNADLTVAVDSFYERTEAKALTLYEVGERLSEIYTGSPCFESSILSQGKWKDLLATSGGLLRNLKKKVELKDEFGNVTGHIQEDWPITYSWEDFYNSLHAIEPVAYGIVTEGAKQKIVLENIDYFFQRYVTVDLGEIQVEERRTASDFYYSSIVTGYTKGGNYEKPLGLDEYNTQTNWNTPITVQRNKLQLLSPSRTDSYGVEDARRRQYAVSVEEDSPYDKDNFLIDATLIQGENRSTAAIFRPRLWEDDFEGIPTGVYSPKTAFNLRLTPANNLLRHSKWFNGGLYSLSDDYLRFTSSEGNSELTTQFLGQDPVKENADFPIEKMERPIFEPEWIKAKKPFNQNILSDIQGHTRINGKPVNNYYGMFKYIPSDTGIEERAFMFSTKIGDEFEFKLLRVYGF